MRLRKHNSIVIISYVPKPQYDCKAHHRGSLWNFWPLGVFFFLTFTGIAASGARPTDLFVDLPIFLATYGFPDKKKILRKFMKFLNVFFFFQLRYLYSLPTPSQGQSASAEMCFVPRKLISHALECTRCKRTHSNEPPMRAAETASFHLFQPQPTSPY